MNCFFCLFYDGFRCSFTARRFYSRSIANRLFSQLLHCRGGKAIQSLTQHTLPLPTAPKLRHCIACYSYSSNQSARHCNTRCSLAAAAGRRGGMTAGIRPRRSPRCYRQSSNLRSSMHVFEKGFVSGEQRKPNGNWMIAHPKKADRGELTIYTCATRIWLVKRVAVRSY